MRCLSLVFLAVFGLIHHTAHAQTQAWDGWFLGLGYTRSSTNLNANYSHRRVIQCGDWNFGSELPGVNCEGNQDYDESIGSHSRAHLPSLFAERLWANDWGVYGLSLGFDQASQHHVQAHRVLSASFGDTLDYKIKLQQAVRMRAIWGRPVNDWLPYVGAGVVLQRASISIRQEMLANDALVDQTKSRWFKGGELLVGVKRKISDEWVASAEFSRQKIGSIDDYIAGSVPTATYLYPNTQMRANADTKMLRLSLSRRF